MFFECSAGYTHESVCLHYRQAFKRPRNSPHAHLQAGDTKIHKYLLPVPYLREGMGSCENCTKLSLSLIEFNSVLLCPACFDREIQRLATIIEP
jgi:hypothetical protein